MEWRPSPRPAPLPSPEAVRETLARILAAPEFSRSERLSRFLGYIVEETLAGRAAAIKESVIAAEVFGRDSSYNPQTNSVVRVEASKLRQRLDHFYQAEGRSEPLVIRVPTGGYVPTFQAAAAPARPPWLRRRVLLSLVVLAVSVLGWFAWHGISRPVSVKSVAVLPLAYPPSDPALALFADGLAIDLSASLARLPRLTVIAQSSAASARRESVDLPSVARRLHGDALFEGSLRRVANGVRLNLRLVEGARSVLLWSAVLDRDAAATLSLHEDIVADLAQHLRWTSPSLPLPPKPVNTAVRDLYWSARAARNHLSREDLLRSIELYRQAAALDPAFAAARAGIAEAYTDLAFHMRGAFEETIPPARAAAAEAIRLDPRQPTALAALARIAFFHDWDWTEAARLFLLALAADPNASGVHREYALALTTRRRFDDALVHARRAQELDPLSSTASDNVALIHFAAGRPGECLSLAARTADLHPAHYAPRALAATCLAASGRFQEAIAQYQRALDLAPERGYILGRPGAAYAKAGDPVRAREIAGRLKSPAGIVEFSHVYPAYVAAALGDHDSALAALEQAAAAREVDVLFAAAEPLFAPLREHPGFQSLRKKLGL